LYQSDRESIARGGDRHRQGLQHLPSPAYEIPGAGEDGVQAERSEFIVRAWTPYAVRPQR
jgi:hypothetical protein